MSVVYLINEEGTDNYKIGITRSKNEKHRKRTLQTGNSQKLNTIYTFKTEHPYRLETMLHTFYANKRGNGEWFQLSDDEVLSFISTCEKLHKILVLLLNNNHFYEIDDIK